MTRFIFALVLGAALSPDSSVAMELELPNGSRMTVERNTTVDSYDAPVAVFDGETVPTITIEGTVNRRAWRIPTAGLTPLQVMAPLRAQLKSQGYDLVFECASDTCGGFDFRFAVEVLPGPNMYVNISAYRYLTALLGPDAGPSRAVTVLVSVTAASAYVQIIDAADVAMDGRIPEPAVSLATAAPPAAPSSQTISSLLEQNGFAILEDLDFATGTSDLGPGPHPSLKTLAELIGARADLRVLLVGHTDASGTLSANVTVSRARAQAVRTRLIERYNIPPDRLDAEGMGYLAPVASNLTEEGRTRNRRVEAVLLPIE
jgi:OOP family OmpA-OmpF porin